MAFEPPKLPFPSVTDSYQKKLQDGIFGATKQNTRIPEFASKLPSSGIGPTLENAELSPIEITAKKINVASPATPDVAPSFLSNILDQYDSYTYHFKLYTMSEKVFESGSNDFGPSSKEKKIILAESGVTTVSIDDVTFTSTVGMTKATGTTFALEFQFTLTQPHGCTVLDYFAAANQQLGNKNWMKAPYYLELTFRARTPDGTTDQKPIKDDSLANLVWVFPLIIQSMDVNVNTGGSVYVVKAAMYSNLAYTNQSFDLESGTSVEASTVGEFYAGLQEKLNFREKEKLASGQFVPDEYEIFIDPVFAGEKLVQGNIDDLAARNGAYAAEGTDKVGMSFQPATSLDLISKSILSCTEYLKKKSTGQSNPEIVSEVGKGQEAAKQTLFRILADTQIIRWDGGRRDYARKYRYLIVPHQMTTIQTPTNEAAGITDKDRYNIIAQSVKKEYNYIYTGLNDQVLDFDLTFNMAWYAAMSIQAGIVSQTSTADTGAVVNPNNTQAKQIEVQESEVQKRQQAADVSMSGANASLNEITQAASYNEQTAVSKDLMDNTKSIFERSATGLLAPNSSLSAPFGTVPGVDTGASSDQFGISASDLSEYARKERIAAVEKKLTGNLTQFEQQNTPTYIERAISGEVEDTGESPFTISYIESDFGQSMNASGDTIGTTGRSLLSTLFAQAESNPMTGDLLSIELKIKGDPYWIEPPAVGRNARLESIFDKALAKRGLGTTAAAPSSSEADVADYINGQAYFVFNSVTSSEWDPVSGLRPPGAAQNNLISGVYGVVTVRHEFSQGQFVQTLVGVRDPKINMSKVKINSEKLPNEQQVPVSKDTLIPARSDSPMAADVTGAIPTNPPSYKDSGLTPLGYQNKYGKEAFAAQAATMTPEEKAAARSLVQQDVSRYQAIYKAGGTIHEDESVTINGTLYTREYINKNGYPEVG